MTDSSLLTHLSFYLFTLIYAKVSFEVSKSFSNDPGLKNEVTVSSVAAPNLWNT